MKKILLITGFAAAGLLMGCGRESKSGQSQDGKADVQLSGRAVIENKGSDTLVNVAQNWAEEYAKVNPNIVVAVSGGGTGTGISALINGTVDLANASRKMTDKEIEAAGKNKIEAVEHIVGYDALAVFVHRNNPLAETTIAKLAAIYGEGGAIDKWSQLGVKVPGCDSDEIVRVSRQNNSGTYAYFKEAVMGDKVEYKLGSMDMHGSKDVVDLVEKTPCAIGYSGLAYATAHARIICVKKDDSAPCIAPTVDTARDLSYPIARPLFMYTAGAPKGALKEYLDWIQSDAGQCVIKNKGYAPIRDVACK